MLSRCRIWLARLLLPRGWQAMNDTQISIAALWGAALASTDPTSCQLIREGGAWSLYVNGERRARGNGV